MDSFTTLTLDFLTSAIGTTSESLASVVAPEHLSMTAPPSTSHPASSDEADVMAALSDYERPCSGVGIRVICIIS